MVDPSTVLVPPTALQAGPRALRCSSRMTEHRPGRHPDRTSGRPRRAGDRVGEPMPVSQSSEPVLVPSRIPCPSPTSCASQGL